MDHKWRMIYTNAFIYLVFLKRKRTDEERTRVCANGRPQWEFITKEESSSPTASTYNLPSCIICHVSSWMLLWKEDKLWHVISWVLFTGQLTRKQSLLFFEVWTGLKVDMICEIDPIYEWEVCCYQQTYYHTSGNPW